MRHLKLTVSYDGTDYVGWQVQPNGIAIQQRLEEGWTKVTGETIRITASGRTDAGVHAIGQVCSLKTESKLPPERLLRAINSNTPFDIAVKEICEAPEDFHAIRDAIEKTYVYHIQYGRIQDPLRLRTCWFIPGTVDSKAMAKAAVTITGRHDFASFESKGAERNSTIRTVSELKITEEKINDFPSIKIAITANGFLYNMVRNIVGTLVEIGKGRRDANWIEFVRDQKARLNAGQTAPAQGLFLDHVVYDDGIRS